MCTKNFTYTKKFYVHEIATVDLSKSYFLKNAKKTCKPNNRDLNRDWINEHIEIDCYHRLSKKKNQNRPRTIVCRITKFKEKQKILKNAKLLKNTGIFIYEDFCKDRMELRKELRQEVLEYRRQNKFAYLTYRSILVRDHGRDSVR